MTHTGRRWRLFAFWLFRQRLSAELIRKPLVQGSAKRQTRRKPVTQSHEATARDARARPVELPNLLGGGLCPVAAGSFGF